MPDHDHSYKLLFSHAEMVRDLIRGFIHEEWVDQLDFSTLEKVNGSYVSDDLRGREDDIIWRLRWGTEWIYIYLLLEFQSTVDNYMAVRMMTYTGLLYQDLIKARQLPDSGQLPPVLPLVLYNGSKRWQAAQDIEDLIQSQPEGLADYRPRMRYLILDEGQFNDQQLKPLKNLVAGLFRLENAQTAEDIRTIMETTKQWYDEQDLAELQRALVIWLKRVLLPARLPGIEIPEVNTVQEMNTMLAERVVEWTKEWKEQGIEQGIEQGKRQGEVRLLKHQLTRRFGDLPAWAESRLENATTEMLEQWGERILDAATPEEVFGE